MNVRNKNNLNVLRVEIIKKKLPFLLTDLIVQWKNIYIHFVHLDLKLFWFRSSGVLPV